MNSVEKMPLIERGCNGTPDKLVWVKLQDICKVIIEKRTLVYVTAQGRYYALTTLEDVASHFDSFGFSSTDKTNIVNLNQVKDYNEELGIVYFHENRSHQPDHTATVAVIYKKLCGERIKKSVLVNRTKAKLSPKVKSIYQVKKLTL